MLGVPVKAYYDQIKRAAVQQVHCLDWMGGAGHRVSRPSQKSVTVRQVSWVTPN